MARNDGDEDGSRLAAKNMAVCCGYLGKEEEGVGNKQGRFREAARHFDMAFRISEKQVRISVMLGDEYFGSEMKRGIGI